MGWWIMVLQPHKELKGDLGLLLRGNERLGRREGFVLPVALWAKIAKLIVCFFTLACLACLVLARSLVAQLTSVLLLPLKGFPTWATL